MYVHIRKPIAYVNVAGIDVVIRLTSTDRLQHNTVVIICEAYVCTCGVQGIEHSIQKASLCIDACMYVCTLSTHRL